MGALARAEELKVSRKDGGSWFKVGFSPNTVTVPKRDSCKHTRAPLGDWYCIWLTSRVSFSRPYEGLDEEVTCEEAFRKIAMLPLAGHTKGSTRR